MRAILDTIRAHLVAEELDPGDAYDVPDLARDLAELGAGRSLSRIRAALRSPRPPSWALHRARRVLAFLQLRGHLPSRFVPRFHLPDRVTDSPGW